MTSIAAMRRLSGDQNGFGGDLRYGEDTGLAGAGAGFMTGDAGAFPGGGDFGFDGGGHFGGGQDDMDGANWMSALNENGCAPGVNLDISSIPDGRDGTVGGGGGYGGIYCFALQP